MHKRIKVIIVVCVVAMISTLIGCTTEVIREESLSINEEDVSKNQEQEATGKNEQLSINNFDIISFENFEKYQENYDEIKTAPYRHRRDDDYTMVDGCWVFARNEESGYSYLWIDKDMNLVLNVDAEQFRVCSDIYEDMTVIEGAADGRKMIINSKEDISDKFVNAEQGEKILGMWKDSTGVSVWTVRVTDTYDSHITELYVKNADGEIKMMWDSEQFTDFCWDDLDKLTFANESVYIFGQSIVDVNGGYSFTCTGGSETEIWGVDENRDVYLSEYEYPQDWFVKRNGVGSELWRCEVNYGGRGQFSDGLTYVRYEGRSKAYQGFIDGTGNLAINCDLNISNTPIFVDDYAVIELENEAGIKFVTLMNRDGDIMFEPIRGQSVDSLVDTHTEYISIAEWKHHIAEVDGKLVVLYADGTIADAPAYWREDDAHCVYLNGGYFVIENGMMNKYDASFSK